MYSEKHVLGHNFLDRGHVPSQRELALLTSALGPPPILQNVNPPIRQSFPLVSPITASGLHSLTRFSTCAKQE